MFMPSRAQRQELFEAVAALINDYIDRLPDLSIAPQVSPAELRSHLAAYQFHQKLPPDEVLRDCMAMLSRWNLHSGHPRCFGLFNPTATFMGILADALVAAVNPQLAVWTHSPVGVEIEQHLITFFGGRFGLPSDKVAGSFTTGGAEANLTGFLLSLTRTFPAFAEEGLRALPGQPVFYASAEAHLAWLKIAHQTGLGRQAVRLVPASPTLQLDLDGLAQQIRNDRAEGLLPFMVVGTAGSTSAGVIDPLPELAALSKREGLRFHVDAAWGGAAVLSDRLRPAMTGIERADSITFDAHKWLSVPMGGGLFLCTDRPGLHETFRVSTSYMPPSEADVVDPYTHSTQWSRRFAGLKLFLSLAVAGQAGYAAVIEEQTDLGDLLRKKLQAAGWQVVNSTPLPVVCWRNPGLAYASDSAEAAGYYARVVEQLTGRGRVWISMARLRGEPALRACITSYLTTPADLDQLIEELETVR